MALTHIPIIISIQNTNMFIFSFITLDFCVLHLKLILLPLLSYNYPPKEHPYNSFNLQLYLVSNKKLVSSTSWNVISF